MLGPHDRRLLLDALRPPEGYALDFAVGTTFSLDLVALLTAPLAFTMFDWQDAEGRPTADPLATLEALRRYADRIAVFCQAGQTAVPKQHRVLFGYLEGSVFEVSPPGPGTSFHPKVWALRFVAPDGAVSDRLLCLSRNLTFDRSWDTALVLEGKLGDRKNAIGTNHPLGDFFAALPGLSKRELPTETRQRIELCAAELRRVPFNPPDGFDEVAYWPLGIPGRKAWPFDGWYSRFLVVSPFISATLLGRVAEVTGDAVLVSRIDSLQEIEPQALEDYSTVYALNPTAEVEEAQANAKESEGENPGEGLPLNSLHAKLYIAEHGWDASVFTGSANATNAAFGGNVEFLVELVGKKSRVGIDAFLRKTEGGVSFAERASPRGLTDDIVSGTHSRSTPTRSSGHAHRSRITPHGRRPDAGGHARHHVPAVPELAPLPLEEPGGQLGWIAPAAARAVATPAGGRERSRRALRRPLRPVPPGHPRGSSRGVPRHRAGHRCPVARRGLPEHRRGLRNPP